MRKRLQARWRWYRRFYGWMPVIAVIVIAVLAVATHRRNEVWRSSSRLWMDSAAKSPMSLRALNNAGLALRIEGKQEQAARYFEAALRLKPLNSHDQTVRSMVQTNMAYVWIERREYQRAFDLVSTAMAERPTLEAMNAMALLMLFANRPDQAVRITGEILDQDNLGQWRLRSSLWATRGQAFQRLGDCNNAMASYVAIKYLRPDFNIPACP